MYIEYGLTRQVTASALEYYATCQKVTDETEPFLHYEFMNLLLLALSWHKRFKCIFGKMAPGHTLLIVRVPDQTWK